MLRSLAAPISVFPLAPPFSQAFSIPPISIESYQNVFRPCLCFFGRGSPQVHLLKYLSPRAGN